MKYLSNPIFIAIAGLLCLALNVPLISHLIAGALATVAAMYMYAYVARSLDSEWYLALMQTEGITLNQLFPDPAIKFGVILALVIACGLFHPILAIAIAGGIFCEQELTK